MVDNVDRAYGGGKGTGATDLVWTLGQQVEKVNFWANFFLGIVG